MSSLGKEGQRMLRRIAELLSQPIISDMDALEYCRLRTPYEQHMEGSGRRVAPQRERPRRYLRELDPIREEMARLLARGLGHVEANPSKFGSTLALQSLYTFPDRHRVSAAREWHGGVEIPNSDRDSAGLFVLGLARAAQESRALCEASYLGNVAKERDLSTERRRLVSRSRWALVGQRGVGKTTFLNYALTSFNEDLHDERVIWVRLDYAKETPEGLSLGRWIEWKICRTLFLWYDEASCESEARRYGKHHPDWQHWVAKRKREMVFDLGPLNDSLYERALDADPAVSREDFNTEIRSIRHKITGEGRMDEVPAWLFRAIWHYLAVDQ
jgi:hypothetical protein